MTQSSQGWPCPVCCAVTAGTPARDTGFPAASLFLLCAFHTVLLLSSHNSSLHHFPGEKQAFTATPQWPSPFWQNSIMPSIFWGASLVFRQSQAHSGPGNSVSVLWSCGNPRDSVLTNQWHQALLLWWPAGDRDTPAAFPRCYLGTPQLRWGWAAVAPGITELRAPLQHTETWALVLVWVF